MPQSPLLHIYGSALIASFFFNPGSGKKNLSRRISAGALLGGVVVVRHMKVLYKGVAWSMYLQFLGGPGPGLARGHIPPLPKLWLRCIMDECWLCAAEFHGEESQQMTETSVGGRGRQMAVDMEIDSWWGSFSEKTTPGSFANLSVTYTHVNLVGLLYSCLLFLQMILSRPQHSCQVASLLKAQELLGPLFLLAGNPNFMIL